MYFIQNQIHKKIDRVPLELFFSPNFHDEFTMMYWMTQLQSHSSG